MKVLAQLKSIEGIASDVRQTRATIISINGAWGNSHLYECFFRLSGAPVALRVTDPIFIEDGETVRVVGIHNGNGVFDAVAYHNRTSGASGNYGHGTIEKFFALGIAVVGGIMAFLIVPFTNLFFRVDIHFGDPLSLMIAFTGLLLLIWGGIRFLQRRSEIRTIKILLNDE
jgi:hypothetical protein